MMVNNLFGKHVTVIDQNGQFHATLIDIKGDFAYVQYGKDTPIDKHPIEFVSIDEINDYS